MLWQYVSHTQWSAAWPDPGSAVGCRIIMAVTWVATRTASACIMTIMMFMGTLRREGTHTRLHQLIDKLLSGALNACSIPMPGLRRCRQVAGFGCSTQAIARFCHTAQRRDGRGARGTVTPTNTTRCEWALQVVGEIH